MAKNDPRSQIPAPVLTSPRDSVPPPIGDAVRPAAPLGPMNDPGRASPNYMPPSQERESRRAEAAMAAAPAITELAARAITNGAAMAREYAAAAGELCRTADTHPQGRANARRLLRLALAHLET